MFDTSRRSLIAAAPGLLLAPSAFAQGPELSGTLADGTRWAVTRPAAWNRTLILDLDGAGPAGPPGGSAMTGFRGWALSQGFAIGGTQREPVGYRFDTAVENLVEVRRLFAARYGQPQRTLALGSSRGAFAARLALELRSEIFAGALVSAGGGQGLIAGLRDKLNAVWALRFLVDPGAPLKLVNITDAAAEQAALTALLGRALSTPQGRARLAMAASFSQFATWTNGSAPKPAPDDYEAQLDQIAASFAFGNPASVRAGVEKVGGGNVSWNTGVDYANLLRISGRAPMIRALYAKAGLDPAGDLANLATAPRISADPAAVAQAEKLVSYTGRIRAPIVNVDNDDPVDPASYKLAYANTLSQARTSDLFRLYWTDTAGHGSIPAVDRAVGLTILTQRLNTGRWPDDSLPALRTMANRLSRTEGVTGMGRSALFSPASVPPPPSEWDARHWGTYRG